MHTVLNVSNVCLFLMCLRSLKVLELWSCSSFNLVDVGIYACMAYDLARSQAKKSRESTLALQTPTLTL